MKDIDLNERLNRLQQSVTVGQQERRERLEMERIANRAKKGRDWNRVLNEEPEIAEHIKITTEKFGKPEFIRVISKGNEILNTQWYK